MENSNDLVYSRSHESILKFDYFICSVAGALFAYLVQTYVPQKLDNIFSILQTLSLLLLALSFFCGIKRIQNSNWATRLNYSYLQAEKGAENVTEQLKGDFTSHHHKITGEEVTVDSLKTKRIALLEESLSHRKLLLKAISRATIFGRLQLYLLFAGFLIIFIAKILQPYQTDL